MLKIIIFIFFTLIFSGLVYGKEFKNFKYGPNERNIFDLWTPESNKPTPLVVYIHGGGFKMGSKEEITSYNKLINKYLDQNIAFAAINYRFLNQIPLQDIMQQDILGFIKFIKKNKSFFNINTSQVFSYGESAGASASLWLATQNKKYIKAAGFINGQLSYDFTLWYDFYGEHIVKKYLGSQLWSRYHLKNYNEIFTQKGIKIRKRLNMYKNLNSDSAPTIFINYLEDDIDRDYNHFIHSPQHAINLYQKSLQVGLNSELVLKNQIKKDKHFIIFDYFLTFINGYNQ